MIIGRCPGIGAPVKNPILMSVVVPLPFFLQTSLKLIGQIYWILQCQGMRLLIVEHVHTLRFHECFQPYTFIAVILLP